MRTSFLAVVALVVTLGGSLVGLTLPLSNLGIERTEMKTLVVDSSGHAWLRGNVELVIGAATFYADEVEVQSSTKELRLSGHVRARVAGVQTAKAKTIKRLADGVTQYRGEVRFSVPNDKTLLADEADYDASTKELQLRGHVRLTETTLQK